MHSENVEAATEARTMQEALSQIGEPVSEAQAKFAALEDCECKEGMFALAATRRRFFAGSDLVAAVGMTAMLPRAAAANLSAARAGVSIACLSQNTSSTHRCTSTSPAVW